MPHDSSDVAVVPEAVAEPREGGRRWRRRATLACYGITALVIAWAISGAWDELPPCNPGNLTWGALMAAGSFVLLGLRGLLNSLVFRLGHTFRAYWDGYCLAVWNTAANIFPLSPGIAAKGLMLHRMYAVGVRDYVALTCCVFLTAMTASGLAAIMALAWLRSTDVWLWAGFLGISSASLVLLPRLRRYLIRHTVLRRVLDESAYLDRNWLTLIAAHLAIVYLESVRLYVAFAIVAAVDISFSAVIIMSSGTILTRLANVTPGGIGIREGIIVGLAAAVDTPLETAVMAAGVDRIASLVGLAANFGVVSVVESHRKRRKALVSVPTGVGIPTGDGDRAMMAAKTGRHGIVPDESNYGPACSVSLDQPNR